MSRTISLRIDDALLAEIEQAGAADRRGRSEVMREALELWLRQRTLAEQVRRHREGYSRKPVAPDEFAPVLEAQLWPK